MISRCLRPAAAALAAFAIGFAAPVHAMGNLQRQDDLAFGDVLVSSQPGTVTVTPSGTVSVQGAVVHLGGAEPARFRVTGNQSQLFSVALPQSAVVTAGSDNMTIKDFTSALTFEQQGNQGTTFTIINVGATIAIQGGQPSGTYIGDFTIIVVFE